MGIRLEANRFQSQTLDSLLFETQPHLPMANKIICIHGLASKPPEAILVDNWKRCISHNLHLYDPVAFPDPNATALRDSIEVVYWANAIPDHLEDDEDYTDALSDCIDELIALREAKAEIFHLPKKWKLSKLSKSFLLSAASTMSSAFSIKDDIAEKKLVEARLYRHDQYIADEIRKPLIEAITSAWDAGDDVMILSHSMGSFIAYDVLWQLSRRNEYAAYRDSRIRYFVTMGSPLGDGYIQSLLFGDRYEDESERHYPANVDSWLNFSAYGDAVCHDGTLNDDFQKTMEHLGLLSSSAMSGRDYVKLWNPFVSVSGKSNPHKSYGYLVQPKLAKWMRSFLLP